METPTMNASYCIGISGAMASKGLFRNDNPLNYSSPLFILQSFLASSMAGITSALLMPLGVPVMVTHILAGISLGPNMLGHIKTFTRAIFPARSYVMLRTYASIGSIIQIFLVSVQMDTTILIRRGRKALIIGISVVVFPLALVSICYLLIPKTMVSKDHPQTFLVVGTIESLSSFPVIANYLIELNILNTECSNIALCSSMVSSILCCLLVLGIQIHQQSSEYTVTSVIVLLINYGIAVVVIVYLLRPIIKWMIKRTRDRQVKKQGNMNIIFVLTMVTALLCTYADIELLFGPFVLGLAIPSAPPSGPFLVRNVDFFNKWLIMPIFYTVHGTLIDNIFKVPATNTLLIVLVVLITIMGKFLGAFLPAVYFEMSYIDSCLLGLIMNAQGFIEILLYTMLTEQEYIDRDCFSIMSVSMLIQTGASAPLVRYLYKNSMKYVLHNKRTMQHLKPNTELRVLGCVYEEENVPSMVHLLKAINPIKETPIYFIIIHFVELLGSATPLLISHAVHKQLPAAAVVSEHIVNVFKRYEENNKRGIAINPYTVVSHYPSMHNDVCMLALSKRTSLIILPYHKNLASGYIEPGIKTVNIGVLENSPCSVAILIDRGLLGGIRFVFTNWVTYHVAVVFLGGADDREALAHGRRMSENPTIVLTVIRFLTTKGNDSDPTDERSLDDALLSDFRFGTTYNNRVTYMEEEVQDGVGVIKVFESMEDKYELIILGRRHDENLPLIVQLTVWNRCSELGTVGDIFVTSGYGGNATLLVTQQQSKKAALSQAYQDEVSQASYDVEK